MRKSLCAVLGLILSGSLFANDYKIIAKVNNDIITSGQLNARMTLGLSKEEALNALILEKLQLQKTTEQEIIEDEEHIQKILADVEKKISDDDKEKKRQILNTLKSQYNIQSKWMKYIRQTFGPLVVISEDEISQKTQEIKDSKNITKYLISELLLDMDIEKAQELVGEIKNGLPFSILAMQFSKSPSSQKGGNLGWLVPGENNSTIEKFLKKNKNPGDLSEPIKTDGGYVVYQIKDVKIPGKPSLETTSYSFCQAILPNSFSDDDLNIHLGGLMNAENCEDFTKKCNASSDIKFQDNKKVLDSSITPVIQDLLRPLKEGEKTKPIKNPEGIIVFMLCQRHVEQDPQITKEQIKFQMEQEKFTLFSEQSIKELREKALIEIMD